MKSRHAFDRPMKSRHAFDQPNKRRVTYHPKVTWRDHMRGEWLHLVEIALYLFILLGLLGGYIVGPYFIVR